MPWTKPFELAAECIIFIPKYREGSQSRKRSRKVTSSQSKSQRWDCIRGYVLLPSTFIDQHPKVVRILEQSSLHVVRNADLPHLPAPQYELVAVEIILDESPKASVDPLLMISDNADFQFISLLIYNTNVKFEYFWRPREVRAAVDRSNCKAFNHLVTRNFEYPGSDSGGILQLAAIRRQEVLMQTVLDNGAEVNSKTVGGSTALHLAVERGSVPSVKLLLDRGAHVDETDGSGCTALHIACQQSLIRIEIVELLLERGADVNAMTAERRTPLYFAAKMGETHVAPLVMLMEYGARFDGKYGRCQGETILHLARMGWSRFCIEQVVFLLEYRCINPEHFLIQIRKFKRPTHEFPDRCFVADHTMKVTALNSLKFSEPPSTLIEIFSVLGYYSPLCRLEFDAEVDLMNSQKLGDTDVSLKDALLRDEYRVSRLLRKPSVSRAIDRDISKERFPIYFNILNHHFKKAKLRIQLQNEGIKSFQILSGGLLKLPDEIVEEIVGHLNTLDILKLKHASEPENGPEND